MLKDNHRSGFIALVGPPNAGKSTLLNAILKRKVSIVSPKPQTTRNRVLGIKDGPDYQMIFLDTPGFYNPPVGKKNSTKALGDFLKRELKESLQGIDITALVIDGQRLLKEEKHLDNVIETLKKSSVSNPDIIVINKVDSIDGRELLPVMKQLYEKFTIDSTRTTDIEIIPVSAKTGDGLKQLESLFLKMLPPGVQYFPEGQTTDQSDEKLAAEIIREKLFLNLNDELPYSIAVRIESWVDQGDLSKIAAVISVERDSQKAIVIGAAGSKLKAVGTAARKDLERVFGNKVFLQLFVRVDENWTESERGLRRVGVGH
jgi:GTP-binding protein Era